MSTSVLFVVLGYFDVEKFFFNIMKINVFRGDLTRRKQLVSTIEKASKVSIMIVGYTDPYNTPSKHETLASNGTFTRFTYR